MIPQSALLDYAGRHYEIDQSAPISGLFKIENSPWLAEPFAAWCDSHTREITLMFGAQMGKNLMDEVCVAYIPIHAPGNVLFYGQTDDDASDFAEERLLKRIKTISHLQAVWPDTPAAWRRDEALLAHMVLKFMGANDSNSRGKSARYLFNDELHLWELGMRKKINKRASAFWNHKILNTSTAGEVGSEIDTAFKEGTMEDWNLGCPECERLVKLRWSEKPRCLVWDANEKTYPQRKRWNLLEVKKTVRFVCPHEDCNAEFKDTTDVRKQMNMLGGYIAQNEEAPGNHRSFHASQLAAHWVQWEAIVEQWIYASEALKGGDISATRTFIIEVLAESWENRVGSSLGVVTGDYTLMEKFKWDKEEGRIMGVDLQARGGQHFWYVVRAFSKDGESRLVACGRADSWAEVDRQREINLVLPQRVNVDPRHESRQVLEACAFFGWKWLEADERSKIYTHMLEDGRKVMRPYAPVSPRDALLGLAGQGTKIAYGMRFSKTWARNTTHRHIVGQGKYWGLPSDIVDLVWTGTSKTRTTYLEQINSWVPCTKLNRITGAREDGWKNIYADDHLRSCEEMILVRAAECGYVTADLKEHPSEEGKG